MFVSTLKKTFAAAALAACVTLPFGAYAATVGEAAPQFTGTTATGESVSLADYKGKVVVLEWTNSGCPFVRKHYDSKNIQNLQKEYTAKDVVWLSVNSSAEGKQGYAVGDELKAEIAKEGNVATAYVSDVSGEIGKLYNAKTTPHLYVIDKEGTLAYAGAIDSIASTDPDDIAKAEPYAKNAIDAVLAGKAVATKETKPYGCGVKYAETEGYHKH